MPTALTTPPVQDLSRSGEPAPALRTPPHNIEAEKALLGAILANNRAYERVSEFLRSEHFALTHNGRVYAAAAALIERGQIADPVTLKRYFEQDETLAEIGGPAYLSELANSAVTVINAGEYGRLVHDLYLKRELIGLGEDLVNRAYAGEVDETAVDQIERAEQGLYDLATSGEYEGGFLPFKDSVLKAIHMAETAHKRVGGLAGVATGLTDLDKILGGLHRSDLIILAGRPSMGKTALATNIAYNAAYSHHQTEGADGAVVGFFSLEMSAEQLASRILSEQTNISSDRMRKGELSNDEFARLSAASQALPQIPIFIDDYLQLITGSVTSRNDGRVQEVSEITRGLKALAKELDVPVLALSQLSRQVEQRDPPRPQLSDLRESGSIEQDADVVNFIFREEYYLERKKPIHRADEDGVAFDNRYAKWEENKRKVANLADIIIAKQRHGPTGEVRLMFQGAFTRFGNLDTDHMPDG